MGRELRVGKGGMLWCLSGRVKGVKMGGLRVVKVGGLRVEKGGMLWCLCGRVMDGKRGMVKAEKRGMEG